MISQVSELFGRQIPADDVNPAVLNQPEIQRRLAIQISGHMVICQRCGRHELKSEVTLPGGAAYCPHCIQMGRLTTATELCSLPEPNAFEISNPILSWEGQLTPLQATCSQRVQHGFETRTDTLLWAVTGAGKTEMLFAGIAWALSHGLRVAVASPRVDVCLELAPRFQKAFKRVNQAVLYGDMEQPYVYRQLTICTTHQLLRFYHAFDVLVIDEVDAFPYASAPGLKYASQNAKKPDGALLYLTATPSDWLQKAVRRQELTMSYLPIRYHGHLLPTILCQTVRRWRSRLKQGNLPHSLVRVIRQNIAQQRRFLLFVPHVADLALVKSALKKVVGEVEITTVHAQDPDRHKKVQRMRDQEVLFLVTTTILERGVTFPEIDVYVLGAEDQVFSTAALVQIAGRAGRSAQDPNGAVRFFIDGVTQNIRAAQKQIKFVNAKARRLKYE